MKCKNCGEEVYVDLEGDLVHSKFEDKGVDPRMCEPDVPDSDIAEVTYSDIEKEIVENTIKKMSEAQEEVIIPLLFEKEFYDIRLEPLERFGENQEFVVSMKCKKTFAITPQVISAVGCDIKHLIERESENTLRNCLGTGVPKRVILGALNNSFGFNVIYDSDIDTNYQSRLRKSHQIIYKRIKEELGL